MLTRLRLHRVVFAGIAFITAIGLEICGAPAFAHDPELSGVRVLCDSNGTFVTVSTHLSRLAQAEQKSPQGFSAADANRAIRHRLRLRFDRRTYRPDEAGGAPSIIRDPANDYLIWQAHYPKNVVKVEALGRLYPNDSASKTILIIVRDGVAVQQVVLDSAHPDFISEQSPAHRPLKHIVQAQAQGPGK